MNVLTANGEVFKSQGIGTIKLKINNLNPVKVKVLVADSKLLGFGLILGIDIIRKLDGIQIISSSKAVFSRRKLPICAALKTRL